MLPLRSLSVSEASRIGGVLFDLDDTFLFEGKLRSEAVMALESLKREGLLLGLVTGRPASWGEFCASLLPIDFAISENGAVAFEREGRRVRRIDSASPQERTRRSEQLAQLVAQIRSSVPELEPAVDASDRLSDFTFDIGEYQTPEPDLIEQAISIAHAHSAQVSRSSIHLHVSFDPIDKASGVMKLLLRRGVDPTAARFTYAYVGDSQNDASAFAAFSTSCGVKNLQGRFSVPPRYVSQAPAGLGFAEFVSELLARRSETPRAAEVKR